MINLIDVLNGFYKIQYLFLVKILIKLVIEGEYFNVVKG